MRIISLYFSASLSAEKSVHLGEKCYPPGFDRECRIQCTKDFVIQMNDRSTVVSENRAQLKACRASCKTAECQPTTKSPTTTKPTTTKRIIHRPVTKKEYIKRWAHENQRDPCPRKQTSRGSDANGNFYKYCDRLLGRENAPRRHVNSRQRLSSGYYKYEYTCSYECTRKYY